MQAGQLLKNKRHERIRRDIRLRTQRDYLDYDHGRPWCSVDRTNDQERGENEECQCRSSNGHSNPTQRNPVNIRIILTIGRRLIIRLILGNLDGEERGMASQREDGGS
jgi:hypothetical protein